MSITAFPVLARILTERKLLRTDVGQATLAAAASDDAMAWCLLALVVALIHNPSNSIIALYVFLTVVAWAIFLWIAIRPILLYLVQCSETKESVSSRQCWLHLCLSASAWFTQAVGVHAIFGLNFSIDSLNDGASWGMVFFVIFVACGGKIIGCTTAAKFAGMSWRESIIFGFLMNTKGLVELIVLNLGLQAGVINTQIFTIFVIMALVTTFMTVPRECDLSMSLYQSTNGTGGTYSEKPAMISSSLRMQWVSHDEPHSNDCSIFNNLSVYALRLVELTSRMSKVMMAESSETLRADPVVNVFRTFGQLNKVGTSRSTGQGSGYPTWADDCEAARLAGLLAKHPGVTLIVVKVESGGVVSTTSLSPPVDTTLASHRRSSIVTTTGAENTVQNANEEEILCCTSNDSRRDNSTPSNG
ncbi:hypothetical protein BSLG_005753 [Batrachochytrium salamandrivorans]|nr:hypothetical protein BSLG_005753 [Batrachochytrium salamandrivorans]